MKNSKQILLTIITVLVTTLLFTNKANAIVMWMQCTATTDGEMYHNSYYDGNNDFKKYNTIATINTISRKSIGIRRVAYVGNDFFSVKGPTFFMNTSHNGDDDNSVCWYSDEHSRGGKFPQCDSEENLISIDQLANGVCPNAMYQTTGAFLDWGTSGATKGDFIVMQGVSNPYAVETLDESKLAIYYYGESESEKYIMIEAYNINGEYGFVYTSNESIQELLRKFNLIFSSDYWILKEDNSGSSLNNFGTGAAYYNDNGFVDQAMATQLVRLSKLGRNYFKIDENKNALLVNTGNPEKATYKLIENINNPILYGNKQWEFVEEWFGENNTSATSKIEKAKKFGENGSYQELIRTAKKINEATDNGKGYTFSSTYDSTKMIEDLKNAYEDLNSVLNNNEIKFAYFDANCEEKSTTDAAASLKSGFYCSMFGKNTLKEYIGINNTIVESVLDDSLLKQINKLSGNNSDINVFNVNDKSKEYAKELAKAVLYLKNNNLIPSNEIELVNKYTKLVESFGVSLVRDCETLIGEEIKGKIEKFATIIKIAVPIILITFGIIDFTKAMFSSDEEGMKKSQKTFIKRLAIAVLFFFTPTIVNLLLSIANKVWPFISPNGCGLF